MRTRFTCGAREFVNRWSECGPTHHFAAATGRHIDTILKVAKIFNVPVEHCDQIKGVPKRGTDQRIRLFGYLDSELRTFV